MQVTRPGEPQQQIAPNPRPIQPRSNVANSAAFDQKLLEATEGLGDLGAHAPNQPLSGTAPSTLQPVGSRASSSRSSASRPSEAFLGMVKVRAQRWEAGQKHPAGANWASNGNGLATGRAESPPARAEAPAVASATVGVLQPAPTPDLDGRTTLPEPTPDVRGTAPSRPLADTNPMALSQFPRPAGDNGRGIHWVPTPRQSPQVVDRFVKEAADMKMKWVVFLNDGTNVGENDYLVRKLTASGIMPVMRVYTPDGAPIQGDLEAMVRHYRALGVQYFQLYNEPNLIFENQGKTPDPQRYLDMWIPAAKAVVRAGGLPGFASLAPGGNFDDIEFLKQALDGVIQRGEVAVLDKAWVSLHNYSLNRPLDYTKDSNGFLKFRFYNQIVQERLGRSMPIIGTEGGTYVGAANDSTMPAISPEMQVQMVKGSYEYMRHAEPYCFVHMYWIIANEEGGGMDKSFRHQALFTKNGPIPVVDVLRGMP